MRIERRSPITQRCLPSCGVGLTVEPQRGLLAHPGSHSVELQVFHGLIDRQTFTLEQGHGLVEVVDGQCGLPTASADADQGLIQTITGQGLRIYFREFLQDLFGCHFLVALHRKWCNRTGIVRIIHLLRYGLALCGAGTPTMWHTAHRWLAVEEYDKELGQHSFCWSCEDVLKKERASA